LAQTRPKLRLIRQSKLQTIRAVNVRRTAIEAARALASAKGKLTGMRSGAYVHTQKARIAAQTTLEWLSVHGYRLAHNGN
jgi:hypothetical protein